MNIKKKTVMSLAIILFLWSIFFYKILFFGENLYCCDNFLINIPSKVFLINQLKLGQFPLWNPYLFSGTPFLADINLGILYPTNLFFFFFSPFRALTLSIVGSVLVALIGMFWSSRILGLSRRGSLFASVVYGFSGTVIVYMGNAPMIQVASLLPWVFGAWVLYVRHQTPRRLVMVSMLSAAQLFAGHPQLTFYTYIFCGVYALTFLSGTLLHRIRVVLPIGILVGLLSGVQLLPFLQLVRDATRLNQGFWGASFGSLPFFSLFRFLLPAIVGDMRNGTDWWQGGSVFGYVGGLSLLFIIAAIKKQKNVLFFATVALIAWLGSFGSKTPIFYILYYLVPGMSLFRVPSHLLLLDTFCSAVLVGFGFEALATKRFSKVPINRFSFILIIVGGFSLLFYRQIGNMLLSLSGISQQLANKFNQLTTAGLYSLVFAVSCNILFFGLSLRIFGISLKRKTRFGATIILLVLLFVDLFLYSRMNLLTVSHAQTDTWQNKTEQIASQIQPLLGNSYRMYVDPSLYASQISPPPKTAKYRTETTWQAGTFRPNVSQAYTIPLIDGYASVIRQPYQRYFNAPSLDPTGVNVGSIENEKINMLSAKYILYPKDKPFDQFRFSVQLSTDTFIVLRNDRARPLVWLETDTATPSGIPFIRPHPGELIVSTQSSTSAMLIVAQQNLPGWNAFIDNSPVSIQPYDGVLQSVVVPPGIHQIRFSYEPQMVLIGLALTILGCIISSALWFTLHEYSPYS